MINSVSLGYKGILLPPAFPLVPRVHLEDLSISSSVLIFIPPKKGREATLEYVRKS